MRWLVLIIVAVLVFRVPPVAVLYFLVLYFLYSFARKLLKSDSSEKSETSDQTLQSSHNSEHQQFGLSFGQLADLLVLRRELNRLLAASTIDNDTYHRLISEIDRLEDRFFSDHGVFPDNQQWLESRESAWNILNTYADEVLGPAPWREPVEQPVSRQEIFEPELSETEEPVPDVSLSDNKVEVPSEATEPQVPEWGQSGGMGNAPDLQNPAASAAGMNAENAAKTLDMESDTPVDISQFPSQPHDLAADIENYAWQRHEPGPLERALKALSGWHALAAPFLVQNIGWFVGVFLFIAGSIFLVSYSSGYLKSLTAFLSFFLFTLFLLWGGYQIRLKRPDLSISSDVILILSVMLMPLTTATVTRLLISSESLPLKFVSGSLAALEFGVFYAAVTLVSALMDRSLQRDLPKIFLMLTFAQLLLALLNAFPYWPLLALAHIVLFFLLSMGVYRFVHDWLHSIFIDRRKIAYFAAGMLVYAALVSFVHLTFGAIREIILPPGYYGPFLIVLCGLLFYVDAQFKHWTASNPSLSRFSFFVYGLSVLALFWVSGHKTATVITLVLAIGLYALVIWNYLTLTPLYLFLACCFWLYRLSVLGYFPETAYFLAALPGLAGLYSLAGWALTKRRSAYLALIAFRVLIILAILLVGWSLAHSQPGILAMTTAAVSCMLCYFALRSAPEYLLSARETVPATDHLTLCRDLLDTDWFYLLTVLAAAAAYYAPQTTGLSNGEQFAFAVFPVVVFWSYKGLSLYAPLLSTDSVNTSERYFNAALMTLLIGAFPIVMLSSPQKVLWLGITGSILLGLSLKLRVRWLFYLTLICWGSAGLIFKVTYFPWPSTGLMPMLLASGVWLFLKYLQYLDNLPIALLQHQQAALRTSMRPAFKLLWCLPVNAKTEGGHDA